MKKDLLTHFSFLVAFFLLISVYRSWISFDFIPFWLGGMVGTLLPDLDHFIYVYFLKPTSPESQKTVAMLKQQNLVGAWDYMVKNRVKRNDLIFHTVYFQLMLVMFSFLIITSGGSLFGTGIMLAFMLHLLVDQFIDYMDNGSIDNWFVKILGALNKKQRVWYMAAHLIVLMAFGFLF